MKNRTRIKSSKSSLCKKKLYTDFCGIGHYEILREYEWKEYIPFFREKLDPKLREFKHDNWVKKSLAKIRTENGIIMKIPFIELCIHSVYADNGKKVMGK